MSAISSQPETCIILGGGGHARALIDCLRASDSSLRCVILETDSSLWGQEILGTPIVGGEHLLEKYVDEGASSFVVGLGSAGDNGPRRRLYERGLSHGLKPVTIAHPTSICSSSARIGPGAQLLPGSIIVAGAILGTNVIVNSGAIVEHDCMLGDSVHIATGALLGGSVQIGDGAHIGLGARVRQSITIGEEAVVGAGAVVVKDVPARTVVVGAPARPLVTSVSQE